MEFEFSSSPYWLEPLLTEKFFNPCLLHETSKKNEKNTFCLDCCMSICSQCISPHRSHPLLQIRRYVYHDVIRLDDLEKLIDCSLVQLLSMKSYTTNNAKVVFLNRRPQSRPFRGSGNICKTCQRSLQDPYLFCSLACKVQRLQKKKKKRFPSKYYYEYQFLRMKGESFCWELEDGLVTPDTFLESPILFQNSSVSAPSHGAWCRKLAYTAKTEFVRKKKSSNVVGPFRPTCSPEISAHLNRRKGIPHRSPLY